MYGIIYALYSASRCANYFALNKEVVSCRDLTCSLPRTSSRLIMTWFLICYFHYLQKLDREKNPPHFEPTTFFV